MPAKFAVLGDGAWGTAIALHLAQNPENRVCLWSASEENACILREKRENIRLLPGVRISDAVELTTDVRQALADTELGIVAIPTVYLRKTLERMIGIWPKELPALSLAKGLENET